MKKNEVIKDRLAEWVEKRVFKRSSNHHPVKQNYWDQQNLSVQSHQHHVWGEF